MRCTICRSGETVPGTTTVTLERGTLTLIVKEVPARVCRNCGEDYVDEGVTEELLSMAENIAKTGAQVDIRKYTPGLALPC